ncbi:MAG: F-box protein, partial [Chlamydiia bacterium]|nr:F-box protein [Chlamydiia bacterium]
MTQSIQGSSAHKRYLEQDQLYFEGPATKTQKVEGVCEDSQLGLSDDRQGKGLSANRLFSIPKMVELLLSYLSRAELGRARRVCKLFRQVIEESQTLQIKVLVGEAINIAKSETDLIPKSIAFLSIVQVDPTAEIIEETKKSLKALINPDYKSEYLSIFKVKFADFVKSVAICDLQEAMNLARMISQNSALESVTVFAFRAIYKASPSEDLFNEVSRFIFEQYPGLIGEIPDIVWAEYIDMFAEIDLEKAKNFVAKIDNEIMQALAKLVFAKKKFSDQWIDQVKKVPYDDDGTFPTCDQILCNVVKLEAGYNLAKAEQTALMIDNSYVQSLAFIEISKKSKQTKHLDEAISLLPHFECEGNKIFIMHK